MTNILIGYIRKWKCDVGVKKKMMTNIIIR